MMTWRRITGAAVLVVIFGALALWHWRQPPPLLNPIASVPFDVSHRGATADAQVRIPQYRSWVIEVSFVGLNHAGLLRMGDLFHGNSRKGIARLKIPLHVSIERYIGSGAAVVRIYNASVAALTPWSHGANDYQVQVVAINLHPGLYSISVTALTQTPELAGFTANLAIEYRPYVQFIPYAVKPVGGK